MVVGVFGVFDKKAEAFMAPFTFPAVGQAVRAFTDTVNDGKSSWCKHPGDFDLYKLCEFDERSGMFAGEKEFLLGAVSVKEQVDTEVMSIFGKDGDNG